MLLAVASPASAEDGAAAAMAPVVIERAWRGFDGYSFVDNLDFYTIELSNPTAEPVSGELRVQYGESFGPRRRFELSAGAKKILRFGEPAGDALRGFTVASVARIVVQLGEIHIESADLQLLTLPYISSGRARLPCTGAWLLVTGTAAASGSARTEEIGGTLEVAIRAPVETLPPSSSYYTGAHGVVLDFDTLSGCAEVQRSALLDYVRRGGVVVLLGRCEPDVMSATGAWESALGHLGTRRFQHESRVFTLAELVEGADLYYCEWPDGERVPLLHRRSLGAGAVYLPLEPPTGSSIDGAAPWLSMDWSAAMRQIQPSRFPVFVTVPVRVASGILARPSAILGMAAMLLAYAILCGIIAARYVRRAAPRSWRGIASLVATSMLAALAIPWVTHLLNERPSPAVYSEICYYRAGSTSGVAMGRLLVCSSGRRTHVVAISGDALRAFVPARSSDDSGDDDSYTAEISEECSLTPAPGRTGHHRGRVTAAPWSLACLDIVGDCELPEPVGGAITTVRNSIAYELELPAWVDPDRIELIQRTGNGSQTAYTIDSNGGPGPWHVTGVLYPDIEVVRRRDTDYGFFSAPEARFEIASVATSGSRGFVRPGSNTFYLLRVVPRRGSLFGTSIESEHLRFAGEMTREEYDGLLTKPRVLGESGPEVLTVDTRLGGILIELPVDAP